MQKIIKFVVFSAEVLQFLSQTTKNFFEVTALKSLKKVSLEQASAS
jgi:hypothetical protein